MLESKVKIGRISKVRKVICEYGKDITEAINDFTSSISDLYDLHIDDITYDFSSDPMYQHSALIRYSYIGVTSLKGGVPSIGASIPAEKLNIPIDENSLVWKKGDMIVSGMSLADCLQKLDYIPQKGDKILI